MLAPPADSCAAGEEEEREEECVKAAKEEKTFTGAATVEHRCVCVAGGRTGGRTDGRMDERTDGRTLTEGVGGGGGLHSGFSPGVIPEERTRLFCIQKHVRSNEVWDDFFLCIRTIFQASFVSVITDTLTKDTLHGSTWNYIAKTQCDEFSFGKLAA